MTAAQVKGVDGAADGERRKAETPTIRRASPGAPTCSPRPKNTSQERARAAPSCRRFCSTHCDARSCARPRCVTSGTARRRAAPCASCLLATRQQDTLPAALASSAPTRSSSGLSRPITGRRRDDAPARCPAPCANNPAPEPRRTITAGQHLRAGARLLGAGTTSRSARMRCARGRTNALDHQADIAEGPDGSATPTSPPPNFVAGATRAGCANVAKSSLTGIPCLRCCASLRTTLRFISFRHSMPRTVTGTPGAGCRAFVARAFDPGREPSGSAAKVACSSRRPDTFWLTISSATTGATSRLLPRHPLEASSRHTYARSMVRAAAKSP